MKNHIGKCLVFALLVIGCGRQHEHQEQGSDAVERDPKLRPPIFSFAPNDSGTAVSVYSSQSSPHMLELTSLFKESSKPYQLSIAAANGQIEKIRTILLSGADPLQESNVKSGYSPLTWAMLTKNLVGFRTLVEAINKEDIPPSLVFRTCMIEDLLTAVEKCGAW